jgi:hypothetical protein
MPDSGEPKIIIDSDWKAQAQKEKERLAAKEREAAAKQASAPKRSAAAAAVPGGVPEGEADDMRELPPGDFTSLVGTLVMQALLYLGGMPDPQTGRAIVSLEHAKYHIDMLTTLEEKTKGNLTPEESSDLSRALTELRMRFVEISKAITQMQAKAAMQAAQGGGGAGAPGGPAPTIADVAPKLRLRTE